MPAAGLAVALDLLLTRSGSRSSGSTASTAAGERFPGQPKMDIALVLEQLGDAKLLVQSAMEELRSRAG